MDDLEGRLAALLDKPEPSAETAARSRSRLQDRARGRARRRIGWLAPATALAAAAAVTAVVVSTGATTTVGTTTVTATTAAAPASAREILLVAAASAERTPQGSGKYWHVRRDWLNSDIPPAETWTGRDGRRWSKNQPEDPPGAVVPDPNPLKLKGAKVSFEDLESLPTDPEALKAWIAERKGRDSGMLPSEKRGDPVITLIALITALPVPSEVRSAAFQALAALPGVQNAGAVEGGQELRIPDPEGYREIKLVIDPETSRVTRTNLFLGDDGGLGMTKGLMSVTTDWTDQIPQ
ncbi:CU044_5270 family protein [Nonomuraea sp. NPDC049695]|uniref:CU044_5270 family protein n=1 Tax=Nonomuraea sp. NPDC049695 TaxID=3154734 RepID=UPI003441AA01